MSRYVVSLGGNALGNNAEEQKELLKGVAKPIVELIKNGHEVIIVHGNGPQVGMINLALTEPEFDQPAMLICAVPPPKTAEIPLYQFAVLSA